MSKPLLLCLGILGGALLAFGVEWALKRPGEVARETATRKALDDANGKIEALERELADLGMAKDEMELQKLQAVQRALEETARSDALMEQIERLRGKEGEGAPGAAAAPTGPLTDDEIMKGVEEFGDSLGAIIQGGGAEAKQAIRDLLARAGKRGVELLVAKFEDDATDIQMRAVLAHALAQSGNPEAVAVLTKILGNPDAGMLELRLATHGLAFSDAPGVDDALLAVAGRSADTGARANAAFGLARRKNPEGIALYAKATDEAMANRDPAALQYLSGFFLLGPEGLPPLRERLLTYTEPQVVLTVIELLKMKNDTGALPNLKKLAADEGKPSSIRKAAEGAVKALEGAK